MNPFVCRSCGRMLTTHGLPRGDESCPSCGRSRIHEPTATDVWQVVVGVARKLAAEQWYGSCTYEPSTSDLVAEAKAQTKADIGRMLLEALGATEAA